MRNPWDRLVSWYSMIQREHRRLPWRQRWFARRPLRMEIWNLAVPYLGGFGRFVRECTGEVLDDGCLKSFAYNQADYVTLDDGRCGVDFVGRYEELEAGVRAVLERLGLPPGILPAALTASPRTACCLHARVCVPGGPRSRERLEHLCRYVARPALASERLSELDD